MYLFVLIVLVSSNTNRYIPSLVVSNRCHLDLIAWDPSNIEIKSANPETADQIRQPGMYRISTVPPGGTVEIPYMQDGMHGPELVAGAVCWAHGVGALVG